MVHRYQLGGLNIVLDTYSGAVHVVDEVAYDIIGLYEDHTADSYSLWTAGRGSYKNRNAPVQAASD